MHQPVYRKSEWSLVKLLGFRINSVHVSHRGVQVHQTLPLLRFRSFECSGITPPAVWSAADCLPPRYLTSDTGLQARGKVQHHELNIFVPASVFDLPTKCSYVTHSFQLCPIKAVQHLGNRQTQVAFRSWQLYSEWCDFLYLWMLFWLQSHCRWSESRMKMKVGSPLIQQCQEKGSPHILRVAEDEKRSGNKVLMWCFQINYWKCVSTTCIWRGLDTPQISLTII